MSDKLFYIQDSRTYAGDVVVWWRPDGKGYTTEINEAGKYPESYLTGLRSTDIPISCDSVDALTPKRVIFAGQLSGIDKVFR